MLKSISKKGFTMVEVLCSMAVFSIIFLCMMSYESASLNIKKDIKTLNDNVLIMDTLKKNIIYSMSFEELEQLLENNKFYINKENMTFDKIKIASVGQFSDQILGANSYIKLSYIKDGLKVYKLTLSLYSGKPKDILELQCNFYKGDHK